MTIPPTRRTRATKKPTGLTANDLSEALDRAFPVFNAEVALARIEEQLATLLKQFDKMSLKIDKMDDEIRELRDVKNRGVGWLAGVALAGGLAAAFFRTIFASLTGGS